MSPATTPVIAGRIHWAPKPRIVIGIARPAACTHWPNGVSPGVALCRLRNPRTRNGPMRLSTAIARIWIMPDSFMSSIRQTTRAPAMLFGRTTVRLSRACGSTYAGHRSAARVMGSPPHLSLTGELEEQRLQRRAVQVESADRDSRLAQGEHEGVHVLLAACTTRPPSSWLAAFTSSSGAARASAPESSLVRIRHTGSGADARSASSRPAATTLPSDRIVALSQISSICAMSWLLRTTVTPSLASAAQRRPQVADARRVHAVGGLVQDEQPGAAQHGRRQPQALPHPEGVAAHLAPRNGSAKPDALERVIDEGGGVTAVQPGEHRQIPSAAEIRVEPRGLDEAAHAVQPLRAGFRPRPPEQPQRPLVGQHQPEHRGQQRRLAGAVGTEQPVDIARAHGEVHRIEGGDLTEPLRYSAYLNRSCYSGHEDDRRSHIWTI